MTNEHNGSHSFDPNSPPTTSGKRQPTDEPQPQRWEHEQDNDSRHVQSVTDRDDRGERGRSEPALMDPEAVITAQKNEHGGIKIGSAFFGWLTATGMAVLLTALVAAIGTGVGLVNNTDLTKATDTATSNSKTVGIIGAIVLLVIVLVAYYCGGYVAGRMARFNGLRQGIAVWVWALVIAIALAILAVIGGQKYNILAKLNAFPRIPVKEGTLTTTGIIALIVVAVASLIGAILGGLAGMHYHRNVDKTGAAVIEDRTHRR